MNFYPEFLPEKEITLEIGMYEDSYFPAVTHRIFASPKIKWAQDIVGRRLIIYGDTIFFQVYPGEPFEYKARLREDRTLQNYKALPIVPDDKIEDILTELTSGSQPQ